MFLVVQVKTVFTMKLEMCNYFLNGKYEDACMQWWHPCFSQTVLLSLIIIMFELFTIVTSS